MVSTFNTIKNAPGIIAKAAAQTLKDNLKFCANIDMADASDFDGKNGYKAGDTIYTSIPARYIPQDTFDITSTIQATTEQKAPLTLDIIKTVGVEFTSLDLATEIGLKSIISRVVVPAAESIAQYTEKEILKRATQATYNMSGTPGSNTFATADVLAGKVNLDQMLAPSGDRMFLMNSASGAKAVDARKGLFQSSEEIAKQYKKGYIGLADGFDWAENELGYTHTNGADVTGVTVKTTATEGASTIVLTGLTINTTGIIKKGTVFTIQGVNKVHPITKTTYGTLQQFVATEDANSDGSGDATVSVSPAFYTATSLGLQNIDALPQASAPVVFAGAASTAYAQNLQFHKSAFKMVSVPLVMPTAVEFAAQETVDGITVAVVRAFDVLQRRMITRLDFLGGFAPVRPEWACRITE